MPNVRPRRRVTRRLSPLPLALAVGALLAGLLACGGSSEHGPATRAELAARVQSAPATYGAGEPFAVTVTFQNTGTAEVSQLGLEASTASDGVAITPPEGAPSALAPGGSADATWLVTTGAARPLAITFRATGVDAGRSRPIEATAVTTVVPLLGIAASAEGDGAIAPAGQVLVAYGGSQAFTMAPADHHHVADVRVDEVSVGPVTTYTFDGVTAGHAIAASFALDTLTIAASAGEDGSVEPSGQVSVGYGGSQAFTIAPAAHHHVADVRVDGASVGAVTSYTFDGVTAGHTLAARFALDTLTIAATSGADGSVEPAGSVAVGYGGSQAFTIAPAAHHHVADVSVDGVSVGAVASYTFSDVTAGHTLAASFAIDTRTLTASAGPNGAVSPLGAVPVPYGGSKTFTITPAAHYHVADVLVDGTSVGAVTTYTFSGVTAGHTLAASFAIDTRTLTASAGPNGAISPSGAVTVPYGGSKAFTLTPDSGYHVAELLVDGESVGATTHYTLSGVVADHTICARFADTWELTVESDGDGTVTPPGPVAVRDGGSQAFSFTPDAHHHVADVRVDGDSIGVRSGYTFSGVGEDHTLGVSFAIDTRTIAAGAGGHGDVEPSGEVQVGYGGSRTFTLVPDGGYHVESVTVDGVAVGAMTRYTFRDVVADHTLSATFAPGAPPRAVFFGSSTTEGVGASDTAHRWTSLFATCFGWTEVNRGLSGSTMTTYDDTRPSAEELWPTSVVAAQPDIVVIQYGANDVTLDVPLGEPREPGAPDEPGTFRSATFAVLGGITAALPGVPVYVVEPQPADALDGREPYDAALAEGAAAFGLPIVHAGQAFAAGEYQADDIHLDDEGHAALARFVAAALADLESWTLPACTF
jgi:lysophospholipase L1-like esterase